MSDEDIYKHCERCGNDTYVNDEGNVYICYRCGDMQIVTDEELKQIRFGLTLQDVIQDAGEE